MSKYEPKFVKVKPGAETLEDWKETAHVQAKAIDSLIKGMEEVEKVATAEIKRLCEALENIASVTYGDISNRPTYWATKMQAEAAEAIRPQ